MSSTRDGLEAALAANPDDVAAHAAYADLLIEEDDPRGEYIQLRLALEEHQPVDRRHAMGQRAYTLHQMHEREWLGPLGAFVGEVSPFDDESGILNVSPVWTRGWVSSLRIELLTPEVAQAICATPILRLMREFGVTAPSEQINVTDHLAPLFMRLGRCPLQTLRFERGPGDALIDLLIESDVIHRLRKLTLWRCRLTDASAQLLLWQLRPGQLQTLDLYANQISALGELGLATIGYTEIGEQFVRPQDDIDP